MNKSAPTKAEGDPVPIGDVLRDLIRKLGGPRPGPKSGSASLKAKAKWQGQRPVGYWLDEA